MVGALLWPRGGSVPPPPAIPSPSPSAAARPRLPEWEIVKLRGELDGVIKDRASREGDLKLMAAHLMPAAQNFK